MYWGLVEDLARAPRRLVNGVWVYDALRALAVEDGEFLLVVQALSPEAWSALLSLAARGPEAVRGLALAVLEASEGPLPPSIAAFRVLRRDVEGARA